MQKIYNSLAVLSLIFIITACANTVNRGHLKEDQVIGNIKPGITEKSQVLKMFGSPSSESTFGVPTWYYISTIKENRSILASKIVDQNVIEIAFDSNGIVDTVKQYSLGDKKDIEIAKQITPTEGQSLGFFEQIFANLGRFNKDSGGGVGNRHGSGTSPSGYPTR